MISLVIETSSDEGSVAIGSGDKLLNEICFKGAGQRRHSSLLFSALEQLELPKLELDQLIIGLGPGSFSGIRVALAAAQGISLVKKIPIKGICSAFSVALQKKEVTRLGVFSDARRGEFYATIFRQGNLEKKSFLLSHTQFEEEISKVTLAVSAESIPLITEKVYPRGRDFLLISDDSPHWISSPNLEPIYLRDAQPATIRGIS